ncbi:MAG: hypothetical protein RIC55_26615 [Pirellulaceae bacterium]
MGEVKRSVFEPDFNRAIKVEATDQRLTAKGVARFLDHTHFQAMRMARHVDYRIDAGYTIGAVLDRLTEKNRRFIGRLKGRSGPAIAFGRGGHDRNMASSRHAEFRADPPFPRFARSSRREGDRVAASTRVAVFSTRAAGASADFRRVAQMNSARPAAAFED